MQYVNTLEPKYSSIDLTEVELPETDNIHNANNEMERDDENTNTLHDVSARNSQNTFRQRNRFALFINHLI